MPYIETLNVKEERKRLIWNSGHAMLTACQQTGSHYRTGHTSLHVCLWEITMFKVLKHHNLFFVRNCAAWALIRLMSIASLSWQQINFAWVCLRYCRNNLIYNSWSSRCVARTFPSGGSIWAGMGQPGRAPSNVGSELALNGPSWSKNGLSC